MVTRGEGGGNAVGPEIGPALGLRRENEDRVAHYRSGTVDIFNLDRVDFFYNTSAPLTQFFWGRTRRCGRITRIIRMTQPDIYIGFTPTLNAGHGNHQQAGRYIWEGVKAAADPTMFPEQLRGPNALEHLAGQEGLLRRQHGRHRRHDHRADCTTGFVPRRPTSTPSPASGPATTRRTTGRPATSRASPRARPKIWAQVHVEGAAAYPTQSRVMSKATAPGLLALRHDALRSCRSSRTRTRTARRTPPRAATTRSCTAPRSPIRAACRSARSSTSPSRASTTRRASPFEATVHVKSGGGALAGGQRGADRAAGLDRRRAEAGRRRHPGARVDGHVHDHAVARRRGQHELQDLRAATRAGGKTGYTDNVVAIVAPVEGRFQRWGKWAEYDDWLEQTAPRRRCSAARPPCSRSAIGETITVPVDVHNWSERAQSGTVSLDAAGGIHRRRDLEALRAAGRRARTPPSTFG